MQRDLWIVGALMAVLFLAALGARDLWNPNEPVYGAAVQEMAEEGRWLLPQVNGRLFPEKPILYFWLGRIAAALTGGTHELALRLQRLCNAVNSLSSSPFALSRTFHSIFPLPRRHRANLSSRIRTGRSPSL